MTANDQPDTALETAMDWLVRLQSAPEDRAQHRAFESWLGADTAHAAAWAQAQKTWTLIGETEPVTAALWRTAAARHGAQTQTVAGQHNMAVQRGQRSRRRVVIGSAVAAALAACIVLAVAPGILLHVRADYVTGAGQLKRVMLSDGTIVELAPETAIATRYAAGRRDVALLQGEAYFDVKHDAARPFAFAAGRATITDVGTAFDVRLDGDATTVDVRRGEVGVRDDHLRPPLDGRLRRGERLSIGRATGAVARGEIDVDQVADWRDHHLYVKGATVAEVVARLRPYVRGWIVIADGALADRRVTGLYDLADPSGALQALVGPAGGRVRRLTPLLYILSSS